MEHPARLAFVVLVVGLQHTKESGVFHPAKVLLLNERAPLKGDAPDATVNLVTAGIAEVHLAMLDDGIGPVGNVERAIGTLLHVDGAKGDVAASDEVALVFCRKAGTALA